MMKRFSMVGILAAAMLAPSAVSAGMCGSGKGYNKSAYGPHHHPHKHAHYRLHHYRAVPHHMYGPMTQMPADASASKHHGAKAGTDDAAIVENKADGNAANLLSTAGDAGSFNILIDAAVAAGLAETLQSGGPYTVFAPSDEAFSRLPEKILSAISADPDALAELLKVHVVAGEVTAAEVAATDSVTSIQGSELAIDTSNGVSIGGATVVDTDIRASNGIIHVIDSVIVPN